MEPSEIKGHGPTTLMGKVTAAKAAKSKARLDAENDKRVKLRMEIEADLARSLDGSAVDVQLQRQCAEIGKHRYKMRIPGYI